MHLATRFYYERIREFDRAVRAGEYPNARSIAERLEVSPRTIQRDIEFLRDRHRAPLVFDSKRNGYAYEDQSFRLSSIRLTQGELIALVVGETVMRAYKGTPFAADLAKALEKIKEVLDDPMPGDPLEFGEAYSFRASAESAADPEIFNILIAAVDSRRRVEMTYWSASREVETTRSADPYHLAAIDSVFYLVAYCHHRQKILTFSPSRIRSITLTEIKFEIRNDFDASKYFADSFTVMRGQDDENHEVTLRFTPEAAKYIRERKWHASQTLESLPDGGIVMQVRVSHLREVERFVMSWGSDCEALGPAILRDRIHRHFLTASNFYLHSPSEDYIRANIVYERTETDAISKSKRGKKSAGD